jgi:hypothetical protein
MGERMNDLRQHRQRGGLPVRIALMGAVLLAVSGNAWSLPSYAQQTGKPCSSCHAIAFGPALTPYGRDFKLNGYVWGEVEHAIPLSVMTVVGYTHTNSALPGDAAPGYGNNNNLAINEITGFVAGRFSEHIGGFVEVAYSGVDKNTAWGAFDVRYARATTIGSTPIVAGLSINNNPTVTDLWNSTPVWSFPYTGSELAPTPEAAPILFDGISERVLGPSVYLMINNLVYLEAGVYFGLPGRWLSTVGLGADENLHMDGVAPYGRANVQLQRGPHYVSAGLLGLEAKLRPDPANSEVDRFSDIGVDATYQYAGDGKHSVNANFSFVHEDRRLGASFAAGESAALNNHLDTIHFDVGYAYEQTWVASLGFFDTSGSSNAGLYMPEEVSGSASASPDSRGYLLQLEYVPFGKVAATSRWNLNIRVGLQYIAYDRFNGRSSDYDGFGRSASDNNTWFGFVWIAL